jgi:uncharacterized protein
MVHLSPHIDFAAACLGGLIIGVSSTGFLVASGKLTGISGIVENSISPGVKLDDKLWAWSYVLGLVLAGLAAGAVDRDRLGIAAEVRVSVLVGALFVGFGTRMGCGCTSGHGISGLPRGSLRALVAVCTFMGVAVCAAPMGRALQNVGVFPVVAPLPYWSPTLVVVLLPLMGAVGVSALLYLYVKWMFAVVPSQLTDVEEPGSTAWLKESKLQHVAIALVAAFVFGVGLAISGMCDPKKVLDFLDFSGPRGWDPSLAGVMASGVVFNAISFHFLHKHGVEVMIKDGEGDDAVTLNNLLKMWKHPANLHLPPSFISGGVMFGLGWGLTGICPGPALVNLGAGSRVSGAFIPPLLVGMGLHEVYKTLPVSGRAQR